MNNKEMIEYRIKEEGKEEFLTFDEANNLVFYFDFPASMISYLYKGKDGNNHVYTPIRGNCVNPETREELGMADIEFIMNELSSLDKISTVACIKAGNILEPDWDLCLTEFLAYERYC